MINMSILLLHSMSVCCTTDMICCERRSGKNRKNYVEEEKSTERGNNEIEKFFEFTSSPVLHFIPFE